MEIKNKDLKNHLSDHNKELLKVSWYSQLFGSFGVASVQDTITGEIKHYIGVAKGLDEEDDVLRILEYGAKFYPEQFSEFIL